METKAAVLYEPNTPMVVETLDLQEPKEGEVLVKIAAAGVCHSDFHIMKGEWTHPLPVVLGHEGAGVVERVGPGVTRMQPGQSVILNFRANCGTCHYCVHYPETANKCLTPVYYGRYLPYFDLARVEWGDRGRGDRPGETLGGGLRGRRGGAAECQERREQTRQPQGARARPASLRRGSHKLRHAVSGATAVSLQ